MPGIDNGLGSKSLGLLAIGFSVAAIPVFNGLRLFPAFQGLALSAVLVGAMACSIFAARWGSKLWLPVAAWPVVCSLAIVWSIRVE